MNRNEAELDEVSWAWLAEYTKDTTPDPEITKIVEDALILLKQTLEKRNR